MTTSNGSPGEFTVEMTGPAQQDYFAVIELAEEFDSGEAVVAAMSRLRTKLEHEARSVGEPMYHLRAMKMEVRKAAVAPLYVEYGVHDDQPLVVIRRVRWLGNPSA